MGSCVSRSGATSTAADQESVHALTAKVVGIDGSMSQFAAPVMAHEALAATAAGGAALPSSHFICCSDASVTAMAAHDALRPGQLYFALPASMLGRPLSAQDMAALAVKACAALGPAAPVVPSSPPPGRSEAAGAAASDKQRRRQATGRVAPLVVVRAEDARGEWKSYRVHGGHKDAVQDGGRTVGKTRNGAGYKGVARDLAPVRRLSVIVEAATE